ncbi:MAG: RNA polymerase sigma factor (sigma-70 family) [Neolewinella sp.]|jgi:RNA polymerase sigma factor (sigma-70 family)
MLKGRVLAYWDVFATLWPTLRKGMFAMTCSPSHLASCSVAFSERERNRAQLISLLEKLGCDGPLDSADSATADAALATALMDSFRKTRDPEAYDGLVRWAGPHLRARVRSRLRSLGAMLDPSEVWQDTIVNIYRYPDRFLASRPGAFAAWSSTIVDNAIRRHLRRSKRDLGITLRDPETLQEQADTSMREPSMEAENNEECRATAAAFGVVLQAYLVAFQRLGERERFVLQMVEVRRMRYAELAQILGIRPEALKMVVFRARKRIHEHLGRLLSGAPAMDAGKAVRAVSRQGVARPAAQDSATQDSGTQDVETASAVA